MENKCCKNCGCSLEYEKRKNKFCNSSCAASFNNKKRKGTYKYKLSETGLLNITNSNKSAETINKCKKTIEINYYKTPKKCKECGKDITYENRKKKFCSDECKHIHLSSNTTEITRQNLSKSLKDFYETEPGKINKEKLKILGKNRVFSNETRKKLSNIKKEQCKDINERIRLGIIGKKGGFGKKGFTKNGIKYESSFEKMCFEFLEEKKIYFEVHKNLPDSSKICDIYLPNQDIWVELDGINREKRKEYLWLDYNRWSEKLKIYKEKKLNYKIFYNFKEFEKFMLL